MPDIEIPLMLEIDKTIIRQVWQGNEIAVPVRDEIQNDARIWESILSAIDSAKSKWSGRLLRGLRRQLRTVVKACELEEDKGRRQMGALTVSEDTLQSLFSLVADPPDIPTQQGGTQKLGYRGSMVDTLADFTDFYEDWKLQEKAGDEADAADSEKESPEAMPTCLPVGMAGRQAE